MNNTLKETSKYTDEDIRELQKERVRLLRTCLKLSAFEKIILSIFIYLNFVDINNKENILTSSLYAIALSARLVFGMTIERLANTIDDGDKLEKIVTVNNIVKTCAMTVCLIVIIISMKKYMV